ncbi:uncharacterized protein LOC114531126 [Dendronephthya gigantea]|uniref:uncharacterized protein LOC114531126 n=1 Tax=Dendronephthya gigantea TaxID=151771 RepID=UPI00106BE67C|nr:uncharacterized protein LOC114531126 [Dendronephthya gigantea]
MVEDSIAFEGRSYYSVMLALLDDLGAVERCPILDPSEYCSEESDSYTVYNSPASSCIDDPNIAAEVEISKDLADEEFSFYEQCLSNLDADLKSSDPLPWANLAHLGDTITEFSLNECRNKQTEGESSQSGSVCTDDYWNRCNSWVNSTTVEDKSYDKECTHKSQSKTKRNCNGIREFMDKLSWKEMTSSQQRETIEHLTQIVSSTMGLREQLDVIRILNPKAVVSSTDTEFEIDLELLNCEKLERIREYVKQHGIQTVKSLKNSQRPVRKTKRKDLNLHRNKGKVDKEQNALLSRVYKQLLKEKRSGLFHNEQVISISKTKLQQTSQNSNNEDDDNDDMEIDILH